ncbi:SMODS domain-containing nucleotidyltransferase [Helicobacter ailurogastricus]|uniref:SMODS domain-containing nucleotidyltransferase n=1 Tax=Helicobacter ailurogastricus TaxID=1578720 RepID=UPI0013158ECB|nr:nucleotidyltransferase domain-containing protein [Helicobacter ailurogastricus]
MGHIKRTKPILEKQAHEILERYRRIAKSLIADFWAEDGDKVILKSCCFFVGSYGRGTAIESSDVDILVHLPEEERDRFDDYKHNGQSALLQNVKEAIQENDRRLSNVRADGQVVIVDFSDGVTFEFLPAFMEIQNSKRKYTYPNSNRGGEWKITNPLDEQKEMHKKNRDSNNLLFDTCRYIRKIKNDEDLPISGYVIDSFVYSAIGKWKWGNGEWGYKGNNSFNSKKDSFESHLLRRAKALGESLKMPGSGDIIRIKQDEAKNLVKILECILCA